MENAAGMISDSDNARLLIRHSIRFDNPVNNDYDPLLLTPEGIELLARAMPIWQRTHDAVDVRLGDFEPARLRQALQAVS